jgi:hypothetical protein
VDFPGGRTAVDCDGGRAKIAGKPAAVIAFLTLGVVVTAADAGVFPSPGKGCIWLSEWGKSPVEDLALSV